MLEIDEKQCRAIAEILRNLEVRDSFYQREFLEFDASRETKMRVYFFSAAICHQTRHLLHGPLNLWGWDYLEYGFLRMVKEHRALLNPSYVNACSKPEVEEMLAITFSPSGRQEDCTLDRMDERIQMLAEICHVLRTNYNSKVTDLIDASEGRLLNNGKGLYETMPVLEAFSDHYRKKITFFIKLATDAGILFIKDPENYIPIMDYHMQRALLRMGCVVLNDSKLFSDLTQQNPQDSDAEIRDACIRAVRFLVKETGQNTLKINDFFWSLGRSCCNKTTLCVDNSCLKSPCTFYEMVELENHESCPWDNVCRGSKEKQFRMLWEPIVNTHFY